MSLTPTVLREYDRGKPDAKATERATFGIGCFWGPDAAFGALDGVIRTRVGYAGGTKANPTYSNLGEHTEVVQVDFDPAKTSYERLLEEIFSSHNPYEQPRKRQYQNLVLTGSESQHEAVIHYLENSDFDRGRVETRIEGLADFHVAEQYHQKYNLRGKRWITDAFEKAGYDARALRESPAAAKLNAHIRGHDVSVPFLDARSR